MVDLDDKIYIQRVLDGETSSFTHLVNKYKGIVFTVCYRIVKQREDAEDLAQVVFMKAFKNLHAFKGNSKFSTWIYTIAYRTAISKSQIKKIEMVTEEFSTDTKVEESFSPIEELKEQEQQHYIQQAIDSLPEIDAVLITLYYMDESSIQEIAAITEMSESNVKVKLHRARKQLKSNLELLLQHELKSII